MSRRTVRRELARGKVTLPTSELVEYQAYGADVAQDDHDTRDTGKGPQFKKEIQPVEHWINHYPREVLDGLSANTAKKRENVA